MKKIILLIILFIKKFDENELFYFANALTYRLLLSIFPFLIFLMTLLAYFDFKVDPSIQSAFMAMPADIRDAFNIFINEVVYTKNLSILSISLVVSIFSASSGFNYLIRGINKAFDIEDNRNFLKVRGISVLLVFVFAFLIIASLIFLIFCDAIEKFLFNFISSGGIIEDIFGMTGYLINAGVLFINLIVIFKLSLCRSIPFKYLFPGTAIIVAGWLIISKFFNIYINNFTKVSVIYGSLGSVFVMLIWLNALSVLILAGNQVNVIIINKKAKKILNNSK